MPVIKPFQLKNHLNGVLKKYPDAGVIGLQTPDEWQSESIIEAGGRSFLALQCDSQLAVREALLRAKQQGTRLVFATRMDDTELGSDLRIRLAKRRLIPIRPWDGVRELFQAVEIDGSVFKKPWLADVLVNHAPAGGYMVAVNGFLTAERIWKEVLHILLRFGAARPAPADIVEWSMDEQKRSLLKEISDDRFEDICEWIDQGTDTLESFLLRLVRSGRRRHLLSLGLTFEVAGGDAAKRRAALRDAAVRMERYTGRLILAPDWIVRFREAAIEAYRNCDQPDLRTRAQEELDTLFNEIGVQEFAWMSSVSTRGFEQRLVRFAETAGDALKKGGEQLFEKTAGRFYDAARHMFADQAPKRIDRMRMALRLIKWARQSEQSEEFARFSDAAAWYYAEGGFVDRARDSLRNGDECKELNNCYAGLLKAVEVLRGRQNRRFAELLKAWTESGASDGGVIKIEDFLDRIIAPIAKRHPVLLIVMDGMSCAVFSELKADMVSKEGWAELTHPEWAPRKPVIAALPTTTDVSRRSLFCGKLTADPKDDESKGFSNHKALCEAGRTSPVLFHKAGLTGSEGLSLSETVRDEIFSPGRKAVGVVVNAVDNSLSSDDQIAHEWRVQHLPVLSRLLHAASDAGRMVIITSDHGHVLDYHTRRFDYDAEQRWRTDNGDPHDGEIAVSGPRVLKPASGRMIAPYSEHIRYANKRNGYHGGVTPQETVIPYAVMKWRGYEKEWEQVPLFEPEWWDISVPEIEQNVESSIPKKRKSRTVSAKAQLDIFSADKSSVSKKTDADEQPDWIEQLLKSPVLAAQKQLCERIAPPDETVFKFLKTLSDHRGTILISTLSTALERPPHRTRHIISVMQRLLNVDGYQTLELDAASGSVTVNMQLLKTQFEMDV